MVGDSPVATTPRRRTGGSPPAGRPRGPVALVITPPRDQAMTLVAQGAALCLIALWFVLGRTG